MRNRELYHFRRTQFRTPFRRNLTLYIERKKKTLPHRPIRAAASKRLKNCGIRIQLVDIDIVT